jgi:hypothetical protein
MRPHHTKSKGDLGLLHAMADLAEKGWGILVPMTEHEAFDLVAYRGTTFVRVQVKYRAAVDGFIAVPFSSCWADRHGVHKLLMDKEVVDLVCVYCPDTKQCYYIDPKRHPRSVQLRIEPPKNGQKKNIHEAARYTQLPFGPLAQLDESKALLKLRPLVRTQQGSRSRRKGRRRGRACEAPLTGWAWRPLAGT